MAFKIALTPTYKVKIVVEIPNEHGGTDTSDFMAEFKRQTTEELDKLRKLPQREVLDKVLVGWTDLLDEQNQAVPYSPANRLALYAIPQALASTIEGFWSSIFKARVGN